MKRIGSILTALVMALILLSGWTAAPSARAEEAYSLPPEEGTRQVIFYWYEDQVDYDTCDMWIWYPNQDGRGYLFHPCEYGVMVALNVPEDISKVGFIVRKKCSNPGGTSWGEATKDYESDRYAEITGPVTEIYLKPGDGNQYMSDDGGKTLYQEKKMTHAGIVDMNQIQYFLNPAVRIESPEQVKVTETETGKSLTVTGLSSLSNQVSTGIVTVEEELDLTRVYTVEVEGYDPVNAMPTKVFDTEAFAERFVYDGDDLGAVIGENGTTFKVWAPTASRVVLNLFEAGDGCDAFDTLEMERGEKGVWTAAAPCGSGTYYTYLVTTAAGEQEAVDPYARAVGVNGNRGMVIDLKDTDPDGFAEDTFSDRTAAYHDAIIWEAHVRDFSVALASSAWPGKYLAFTEHGLTNGSGEPAGLDYLTDLGITHVHVQPVFDFASVDEAAEEPQYNWGYDPQNYNAPEGSYSTDPFHGEVRIRELKQMIQALHQSGLGIVMDMVYNHTYEGNSSLNRIVPYYYYRFDSTGAWSNGSGCGNETASERAMFRKFMVDSVCYWAKEYHVDGFRFDLMALHDVKTMQEIESAVHAINPGAILYGEGWTGGTTTLMQPLQANQANIRQIAASEGAAGAIAVFNDATRDGLKGSVFNAKEKGYISGNVTKGTAYQVAFGLEGGVRNLMVSWSADNDGVINYMACHDNHTLYDRLLASNPDDTPEDRLKMNRFGISIIMTGRGIPFILAGEEMLRSKGGDSNSYRSGDEVNQIRWDDLTPGSDVMAMRDFYRDLISLRQANRFITEDEMTYEVLQDHSIEIHWTRDGRTTAWAMINPGPAKYTVLPDGEWQTLMLNEEIRPEGGDAISGTVRAEERTVLLVRAR